MLELQVMFDTKALVTVLMLTASAAANTADASPDTAEPHSRQRPVSAPQPGMALVPGGRFEMGCKDCNLEDALPLHWVELSPFWMDETPVTNAAFKVFVDATGYKTIAERALDPKDYPT